MYKNNIGGQSELFAPLVENKEDDSDEETPDLIQLNLGSEDVVCIIQQKFDKTR